MAVSMIPNEEYTWYALKVNPVPWAVGPIGYARRGGKMTAYMGRNEELHAYKEAIREELESLPEKPIMIPAGHAIALRMYFWRQIDEYETSRGRTARSHEADATNMQKATEDALQGILFKNDKDVIDIHSQIMSQNPDSPYGVVIGVCEIKNSYFHGCPSWAFEKIMTREEPEWLLPKGEEVF